MASAWIFLVNLLLIFIYSPMILSDQVLHMINCESLRYELWLTEPFLMLSSFTHLPIQIGLDSKGIFVYLLFIFGLGIGLFFRNAFTYRIVLIIQVVKFFWTIGILLVNVFIVPQWDLLYSMTGKFMLTTFPAVLIWIILTRPSVMGEFFSLRGEEKSMDDSHL
jgi:hypothetical protein